MAILKHFNVKNKDYSAIVRYCVFQHDEHARPLKDEQGHFILREDFLIDGINCCPLSYDIECRTSNRQWGKNLNENDIRQHTFVISFEPSDIERGLTVDKAQELGMEFARKLFAGHQCIVATHSDGNNHSKNIHCHISFNSLRIEDLPELPTYTQFERDRLAGYKFHPTDACMRYLKDQLMELCRSNGLGQVELNKPAKKHITDKEYWAQKRGQEHISSEPTKFQTELEQIRRAIGDVKERATSVEDFKAILLKDYGISIRDKRGRWSYQTTGRKNGVTARRLGAYTMESVIMFIEEQVQRKKQKELDRKTAEKQSNSIISITDRIPMDSVSEEPLQLYVANRIYDLNEPKFKDNLGLQEWAKLQNLKEMSRRFNFICETISGEGVWAERLVKRTKDYQNELSAKKGVKLNKERQLNDINKLLQWEGQLNKTKAVYQQYCALTNKKQKNLFYQQHKKELDLRHSAYQNLTEYKKAHGYDDKPLPSMKKLSAMKAELEADLKTLADEIVTLQSNVNLLTAAQEDVAGACQKLNLVTRSEYAEIFGKKMSIRSQLKQKKPQAEQDSQRKHQKSHDYQDLQ